VVARRGTTARAVALPDRRGLPDVARLTPSLRSLAVGLALLALAIGGYLAARDTSLFAVRTIDVRGGTPALRAAVRSALRDELGVSLVRVNRAAIEQRVASLSGVRSFRYDRTFPHTLTVVVQPERPVLVLRQGDRAYLVAATGRVLRPLAHPHLSSLPRLYVKKDVRVSVGAVPAPLVGSGAYAAALVRGAHVTGGVRFVRAGVGELTLILGGGSDFELRLGDVSDLRLKLAIARRILTATGAVTAGPGYLDVSLPERPVLDQNSQVGG
jgi:POTRA domain, FtsQ-type